MDLHHLLEAAGIVVAGVLFYSLAYGWSEPDDPRRRPLWVAVLGLAWGGIAVVLMISRIETSEGVFIDGRVIPVAVIGLFEGWGAGLLAALPAVTYRIWLGGSGSLAGIMTVLAVAAAAGLTHRWAGSTVRIQHAAAVAAATFLITFGGFGLLGDRGRAMFARVWPSYLALTAIGIPALALLMETIVERRVLTQERERFRAVLDGATDAMRVNLLAQAAAHEINNPLAVITGYLQMLEERLPPGTEESHWAHNCRNAAVRIRDAVGRLSRIVRVEPTQPSRTLPPILDTKRSTEQLRDDAGR